MSRARFLAAGLALTLGAAGAAQAQAQPSSDCDALCMEDIADQYRAAYLAHDPSLAPFAETVRYTENNVEMPFPDGTWDTVTAEPGPHQYFSDPVTGNVAIFTAIMQREVEGYLAVRLKIEGQEITEVEHIISTRRNLSSPPTPIGPIDEYMHEFFVDEIEPEGERLSREMLAAHANGYFDTLQRNDGEIRGTCFHDYATRRENGMLFTDIKGGFESGRYWVNDRVRREIILIDERRQVSMGRGFIDHKGVIDEYALTDGEVIRSVYQEPQSWAFLEAFKVAEGCIAAVLATFFQPPYYQRSPWTEGPDR